MAKDLGDGFEVINESLSARTAVVTDKSVDKGLGLSGAGLSGAEYLPAAIATNMPLDLVIIMLGTNDVKPVYNRTALQVSLDVMSLVAEAQKDTGVATSYPAPKVLVVVPPHLGKIANVDWVQAMFPQASVVESGQIAEYLCPLAESVRVLGFEGGSVAEIAGPRASTCRQRITRSPAARSLPKFSKFCSKSALEPPHPEGCGGAGREQRLVCGVAGRI